MCASHCRIRVYTEARLYMTHESKGGTAAGLRGCAARMTLKNMTRYIAMVGCGRGFWAVGMAEIGMMCVSDGDGRRHDFVFCFWCDPSSTQHVGPRYE